MDRACDEVTVVDYPDGRLSIRYNDGIHICGLSVAGFLLIAAIVARSPLDVKRL